MMRKGSSDTWTNWWTLYSPPGRSHDKFQIAIWHTVASGFPPRYHTFSVYDKKTKLFLMLLEYVIHREEWKFQWTTEGLELTTDVKLYLLTIILRYYREPNNRTTN